MSNIDYVITDRIREKRKIDQLRLFTLKHELLKISVRLQNAFAAE
jgi:hypothetical protein